MNKVVVLVSGGGTNLQAIIDNVKSGYLDIDIVGVISDRKDSYALKRAEMSGIYNKCICLKDMGRKKFDCCLSDEVSKLNPDLIVLAGFLTILSSDIVKKYTGKIINIHPSLIPSFCGKGFYGRKVHEAVIDYGVKVSGCTVHFVDSGADTGPIIFQETVDVLDDDTPESLADRILKHEHVVLSKAINYYFGGKLKIQGRRVKITE